MRDFTSHTHTIGSWYLQGFFSKPPMSTPSFLHGSPNEIQTLLRKSKVVFTFQYTLTFLPTSLDIEAYSKAPCKSFLKFKISPFSFSNSYKTGEWKGQKINSVCYVKTHIDELYRFTQYRLHLVSIHHHACKSFWSGFFFPLFYYNIFFKG